MVTRTNTSLINAAADLADDPINPVDGEEPVTLGVGDSAYWRAGQWSTWTMDDHVRKHAVLRVPVPGPLAYLVNGFRRRRYAVR